MVSLTSQNMHEAVLLKRQQLYAETDSAICIGRPGLKTEEAFKVGKTWIPSSLVLHNTFNGVGSVSDVEVYKWFAEKENLEYVES